MKNKFLLGLSFLLLLLTACSPVRFFYYPDNKLYLDPATLKIPYEMKWYSSLNQKKLFALYFPTPDKPKGLVVHFHGNFGNVSNHFPMSYFLTKYGYDVLVFDYQGYGGSEGKPSPKKMTEDGLATLAFAQSINRSEQKRLFIFGHSLGGAVALAVLAQHPKVNAAVIQSAFTSYRVMARHVLKQQILTWPLYPFIPWFVGTREDPIKAVSKIKEIPLLFIHGQQDEVVPVSMAKILFSKAQDPKELWLIPSARHNNVRQVGGADYEKRMASFFDRWN